MKIAYLISLGILWACIAMNCYCMYRNMRLSKLYNEAIDSLNRAKAGYEEATETLDKALDAVMQNHIEEAIAAFENEEEAAE